MEPNQRSGVSTKLVENGALSNLPWFPTGQLTGNEILQALVALNRSECKLHTIMERKKGRQTFNIWILSFVFPFCCLGFLGLSVPG